MTASPRKVMAVLATVTVLFAPLAGCGEDTAPRVGATPEPSTTPPPGLDAEGVAAWQRWEELGLDTYRYRLTVGCFCPAVVGVEVVVRDGEVVRLDGKPYDPTGTVTGFAQRPPTVDSLFAVLGEYLQKADEVSVEYEPDTGVPASIQVDQLANAIDDEISYQVERLSPFVPEG